jgi:hypothetical protein
VVAVAASVVAASVVAASVVAASVVAASVVAASVVAASLVAALPVAASLVAASAAGLRCRRWRSRCCRCCLRTSFSCWRFLRKSGSLLFGFRRALRLTVDSVVMLALHP